MTRKQDSDLTSLLEEREANAFPFSRTPFVRGLVVTEPDKGDEPGKELEVGELRVKAPEEVPWIDLLLEIAMTTAFASLTDGTPILRWDNALSYVCYFFFVWWIWVAQVAYNMRFRQADWLHRICVFAQLLVFSALSAFTKDFDITSGLRQQPDQALTDKLLTQLGSDPNQLAASNFRDARLPRLNSRGVSMVMAISRIVLFLQYVVVFYHAQGLKRTSLKAHMVPLVFSSLCYFSAFVVVGSIEGNENVAPSQRVEIIKLVLWYLPIFVEIYSHFVALNLPGFVRYSTDSIYARSATVFLIILGSGLDKITGGFKLIIGNTGLGHDGIPLFIAAAVIFIGYFSLYFGTPGSTRELGNRRALAWFFSQFFFLAALIVTLQGIANSLAFSNLNGAIIKSDQAMAPLFESMNNHPGVNLTANSFNASKLLFNKWGLAFDDIVNDLNKYITLAQKSNNSDIIRTGQLWEEMAIYYYLLKTFEATPPAGSLLSAQMGVFLYSPLTNTSEINEATFANLYDDILKIRGSSALWLYPAAGSAILALVLMSFVKGLPRDKWEWSLVISRFLVGSGICFLTIFDIGASKPILNSDGKLTDCIIWVVAVGRKHLLLIILAATMGVLQIVEHSFAFAANRSYHSFAGIDFLNGPERRRTIRQSRLASQYERASYISDPVPLAPVNYSNQASPKSLYTKSNSPHRTPGSDISLQNTLYVGVYHRQHR